MSKKVADIIVETLQTAGVRHCYGVVGDTLNLIARSLERSKIEWVSVRHEEAGAFAAQAEAQVTGHLTAVAGSCGPGSLHFINGICPICHSISTQASATTPTTMMAESRS